MAAPTPQELLAAIQEAFQKQLEAKTNWGRNEVLVAFERAKSEALVRFIG